MVDSTRSLTSKTELLSLFADEANVVRGQMGIDLPWFCVGSHKIGHGLLTGGNSTSRSEIVVVSGYGCTVVILKRGHDTFSDQQQ